jgi:hypothetical protein
VQLLTKQVGRGIVPAPETLSYTGTNVQQHGTNNCLTCC